VTLWYVDERAATAVGVEIPEGVRKRAAKVL
jgi:hypothetical protein